MNRQRTGDIVSDDIIGASAAGCEVEDQGMLQQESLKRLERSLQKSALKGWKIRKLPCEQEFKLAPTRNRRTGTKY